MSFSTKNFFLCFFNWSHLLLCIILKKIYIYWLVWDSDVHIVTKVWNYSLIIHFYDVLDKNVVYYSNCIKPRCLYLYRFNKYIDVPFLISCLVFLTCLIYFLTFMFRATLFFSSINYFDYITLQKVKTDAR